MLPLYKHQQRFLDENPERALLCWDCGTGKTLAAILWMQTRPSISFLVVCPKQIVHQWKKEAPVNAIIVSKEQYKKYKEPYEGIVVDEADHGFGSPLFKKGRSDMAKTLYTWIRAHDTAPILLLTATPIRNAPHTSHTLLSYIQKAPTWKQYQEKQYALVRRPYNPWPFWEAKKGWQKVSARMISRNASVASLSDIATVPTQSNEKVKMPKTSIRSICKTWHDAAKHESGDDKLVWIRKYAKDKRKVVIVSRYLDTIHSYAAVLSKEREVFLVTGATKNQEQVLQDARNSFECYLFIQADLAAGYELPEFSYMIFVSLSFSVRSLTQMKGRLLRGNALKSNWYTYLLGGPLDSKVYQRVCVELQDFVI